MDEIIERVGLVIGLLVLTAPAGLLAGAVGVRTRRWFWIVSVILMTLAVLLFMPLPPERTPKEIAISTLLSGGATLVDALVFRAGFMALGRWRRRKAQG